jgi:phosphoglycerate dehydrogenase-like enzyme
VCSLILANSFAGNGQTAIVPPDHVGSANVKAINVAPASGRHMLFELIVTQPLVPMCHSQDRVAVSMAVLALATVLSHTRAALYYKRWLGMSASLSFAN